MFVRGFVQSGPAGGMAEKAGYDALEEGPVYWRRLNEVDGILASRWNQRLYALYRVRSETLYNGKLGFTLCWGKDFSNRRRVLDKVGHQVRPRPVGGLFPSLPRFTKQTAWEGSPNRAEASADDCEKFEKLRRHLGMPMRPAATPQRPKVVDHHGA